MNTSVQPLEQPSKIYESISKIPSKHSSPKYMLNYQAYYDKPIDYLSKKDRSPRKKRKPTFTDGIDPKFLLTDEETAKSEEELREIQRLKEFQE